MRPDRPDDPDVPPDRRDHQPARPQAETRTRQEYYADLRVTVARQEAAATRQATAEEQSTSEKWQHKVTEFRQLWTEHQRKWPPEDRPPPDRSAHPPGSWRGGRDRFLNPSDNSQVEIECDRIVEREREKITPAYAPSKAKTPTAT